jgi:glutamate synthase (NADPH) small chain
MPNKILVKEQLIPGQTSKLVLDAPEIASHAKPGNFVILRISEQGERIPLTIADTDKKNGTITIVYLVLGKSTAALEAMGEGDEILDVCGPLGQATEIHKGGTVICVGGGTGIAAMHHIAKGHHLSGNHVVAIIGARSKDLLLFHDELSAFCPEVLVSTDDGSFGRKGLVTDILKDKMAEINDITEVVAIGPVPMMRAVSEVTRPSGLKTTVSLNSIMVDGMGMCGACRVTVGGKTLFTCVDGPEFDGHDVDFDELQKRLNAFKHQETQSMDQYKEACKCKTGSDKKKAKRMLKPRTPMPVQAPEVRVTNFKEVALGYTLDQAIAEANRCLQCKNPKCVPGCPVEVPIPQFIDALAKGDIDAAYRILKSTNALPAVCGRVCPQENQCEEVCILANKGEPVCIGRLERFVADEHMTLEACGYLTGKMECRLVDHDMKVACIGSGPASLTAAGYLSALGAKVTIFEALHELGGVLVYGIPEFRLPKSIVKKEIAALKTQEVEFRTNWVAGRTVTIPELFDQGYKAVFLGVGAGLPKFLNIPGENLIGVYSANEYLTRANLGRAYDFPNYDTPISLGEHVAVFGGGNVAMDAARTALRLGAKKVSIVYRRTKDEIPARLEELEHAIEEGVHLELLCAPTAFYGDEKGVLKSMTLQRMKLGEPDDSGRRRPVVIEGETVDMDVDLAVVAVGTNPNPLLLEATPELDLNKWGYIKADEETCETSMPGVYAGGDIVTGAATVILAAGAGRRAAKAIAEKLGIEE